MEQQGQLSQEHHGAVQQHHQASLCMQSTSAGCELTVNEYIITPVFIQHDYLTGKHSQKCSWFLDIWLVEQEKVLSMDNKHWSLYTHTHTQGRCIHGGPPE